MSKTNNNIWLCIEALEAALDGDRKSAEETLDQLEGDLRKLTRSARGEMRRKMICIVAQLSRLEVRMMTSDGPLTDSV